MDRNNYALLRSDGASGLSKPREGGEDWHPLGVALRILAATGQPMLSRQLSDKLERLSIPLAKEALEELLLAAAEDDPRLLRDGFGRWRLAGPVSGREPL